MVIMVNSGSGNLADYLINGNDNKRDKDKVFILDGDLNLTKKIAEDTDYTEKHFHIVVSLKGKYENEVVSDIYKDFKSELLNAYREDEVNISAVLHQDTDNTHFHCIIPKKNLLTNKKLDLYFDKRDRQRFELIRDYIDIKYNLVSPNDKELKPITKATAITKNWKSDTKSLKTKKDKAEFEQELLNKIHSNIHLFKNQEELLNYLKENIDIEKFGYDYKKNKFYATIKHEFTKQRVFSDIFNTGDLKYNLNSKNEKVYEKFDFDEFLFSNKKTDLSHNRLNKLRDKLNIANIKYSDFIDNRIGKARRKAIDKLNNVIEPLNKDITFKPSINKEEHPTFLTQNKKLYKDLDFLNKSDISQVATKFFDFKELKRGEDFSLIKNDKSNELFLVYKDKNDYYNYINPASKVGGTTVDFLGKFLQAPFLSTFVIDPIIAYLKELKSVLKEISKIVLNELLEGILRTMDKSNNLDTSMTFKGRDMALNRDLKPY